jgi:hypothetical protein
MAKMKPQGWDTLPRHSKLADCMWPLASGGGVGCMPASAVHDLTKAVPDELVQAIVRDQRRGLSDPGWLPPDPPDEPVKHTGGWQKPEPLGLPPGIKWCDQMMDVADASIGET